MHEAKKIILNVKPKARIGLLGGSFDPPHLCHQLLALSFLSLENIDYLWIIPCADHAFKKELTPFADRLAMCRLAFARIKNVEILDLEKNLPRPNYTINTVEFIKTCRPDLSLTMALGSDLVPRFSNWQSALLLTQKTKIVIFEREEHRLDSFPEILHQATTHKGYVLPNVNSTKLRQILSNNKKIEEWVFLDSSVKKYVEDNQIYSTKNS